VEKIAETDIGTQLAERRPHPPASNLDPKISPELDDEGVYWHAIQIRYQFEKKATQELQARGVEAFLPLRVEVHRWSDRHKEIQVPLFPGYAFVRIAQSSYWRLRVLTTPGVIGFVEFQRTAAAVPASQIEYIRALLSKKVPCSLHGFLRAGQKVRIRGGCLDGVEGFLAQNGKKHLVISIECIQRSIAIEIDGYELEPA
jgi:transcription antitermination factor NusG